MDVVEHWARFLAERFTAITSRRDDEPVDVCRFHREIAEDIVERLSADQRGAVDALRELREFAEIPDDVESDADWLVSARHIRRVCDDALGGRSETAPASDELQAPEGNDG